MNTTQEQTPAPDSGGPSNGNQHAGRWIAAGLAILMPLLAYWYRPTSSMEFPEASLAHVWRAEKSPVEPVTVEATRELARNVMPFKVVSRIPALEENEMYPCSECHDGEEEVNMEVRDLEEEHESIVLAHGDEKFWCLNCHNAEDRDKLKGINGEEIGFNEVHLLCGQCHYQHEKDFLLGAHGKTVERIPSTDTSPPMRVVQLCTACHSPHDPVLKPREGCCMPMARAGLTRPELDRGVHEPFWNHGGEKGAAKPKGGQHESE